MRLGYFEDFKGSHTVLLSCSAREVAELRLALRNAMDSNKALAVHQMSDVQVRKQTRLFLGTASAPSIDGSFALRLDRTEFENVDSMLEALEGASAGHQYFSLPGEITLMLSVGEYDDSWWDRHS
jgi:hypothetical protein